MVKVLLIGHGAREHCIAESFKDAELYAYMKSRNPGIMKLAISYKVGSYDDIDAIKNFASSIKPDFAFIGPEDPLDKGIVDALESIGIKSVGPRKELARLETSKSFTRLLMEKYNIPGLPKFEVFKSLEGIKDYLDELDEVVIKPDGLTGGKGVRVQGDHFETKKEALNYCAEVLKTHSAVIIEEKLEGEEFSLQTLTDGSSFLNFPLAQDHKRAYEDDKGPNTGGMGSYSCADHLLPFLSKDDLMYASEITKKVAYAIEKEIGYKYKGVMYGGFILTPKGVKLLEYNARFGDPEVMNVLPLLKNNFVEICQAVIDESLKNIKVEFEKKATVCKYVVPQGYPTNPVSGKISLGDVPEKVKVYYASVEQHDNELFLTSSRAIAFVGIDESIEEAERIAEEAISKVDGPVFHRRDIGTQKLINKRVKHMQLLRNEI